MAEVTRMTVDEVVSYFYLQVRALEAVPAALEERVDGCGALSQLTADLGRREAVEIAEHECRPLRGGYRR